MVAVDFGEPNIGRSESGRVSHFRTSESFERFAAVYRECLDLLPAPAEQYTVPTSFGSVRAYRFGEDTGGAPLVLLPGRSSCTPLWLANLPGLMPGRTVYSIDSIGEPGCSVQTRPITSAADQATWIDEAVEALGLPAVNLMGVSIGGWLSMQVAVHRPERVNSVIALDPAMTFGRVTGKAILVSMGSLIPGLPAGVRSRLLGAMSGGVRNTGDLPEGRLVASGMRDFKVALPQPKLLTDDELRGLSAPVLALIAGRSIIHKPQAAFDRAQSLLPAGSVELWPDASHAINGEYPAEIAARVNEFLVAVGPS